ncbi:hypothetical protein [Brevundimonas diminuta]|uniref:hypothetical protein n=1 Tax=Brevundimonas diminuta TaxID=293 RepID=UPI000B350370|nr:hypothetical protein [Brevundimonas diminuta]
MTADLSALIARLEAAEVGSRELDAHVEIAARAFEAAKTGLAREHWAIWRASSSGIVSDGATQYASATVTTSLDAALALAERVLPDREIALSQRKPRHLETCAEWWHASLFKVRTGVVFGVGPSTVTAKASTPALALAIAILRAKQGEG